MSRIDIKVGFSCNNHCRFCVEGDRRRRFKDRTTDEIKRILLESRENADDVVFSGGEFSIRNDAIELVEYAKSLKFNVIQFQTNGRMFAYPEFCKKTVKAGVNSFGFSIHGHNHEIHDYLTNSKGSFLQLIKGIINLKYLGQEVVTNTVITKQNFRFLPNIARLLLKLKVPQLQFAFPHILGNARKNLQYIVPLKYLIIPYVKKAIEIGRDSGAIVTTQAIPYCFLVGYENHIAERIIPSTRVHDLDRTIENFNPVRYSESKARGPKCPECKYYDICEGPWREYPEYFGWDEFKPVRE